MDIPETSVDERVFVEDDDDINQDNNYGYDRIGNLVRDNREGIETIHWTTSGKVREVLRIGGSIAPILRFSYDAGGHRLVKRVDLPDGSERAEYYIRDAQGNVMATYKHRFTPATGNDPDISLFHVVERPMYGSSRLGVDAQEVDLATATPAAPTTAHPGQWRYELTDHLGNVQAVVTEELLGLDGNNDESVDQWAPVLLSAQDYEAFGSLLPGRNYSSGSYRFGFQGQEKDDEMHGATGTSYAFEYRVHDARVGRFLSIDPLASKYPHYTPYSFSGNRLIHAVEYEGLEEVIIHVYHLNDGTAKITAYSYGDANYNIIKEQMFKMGVVVDENNWTSPKGAYTLGSTVDNNYGGGWSGPTRGTLVIEGHQNNSIPSTWYYDPANVGLYDTYQANRRGVELSGMGDIVVGGIGIAGSILTEAGTFGFATAIAAAAYWRSADQFMGGMNKLMTPDVYMQENAESQPIRALVGQFTGSDGQIFYDVIGIGSGFKGAMESKGNLEKIVGAYSAMDDAFKFVNDMMNENK